MKKVYLSGPMDGIAKNLSIIWRKQLTQFLHKYGILVLNPWDKPNPLSKDIFSIHNWSFREGLKEEHDRNELHLLAQQYISGPDLAMVSEADTVISFVPKDIYSVGTTNEIFHALSEKKQIFFISGNYANPEDKTPYIWYIARIEPEFFFDGFGFLSAAQEFGWEANIQQIIEANDKIERPLLPYLDKILTI